MHRTMHRAMFRRCERGRGSNRRRFVPINANYTPPEMEGPGLCFGSVNERVERLLIETAQDQHLAARQERRVELEARVLYGD